MTIEIIETNYGVESRAISNYPSATYKNNPMKEQLTAEKQANLEKIKSEEQALQEMERIFKHAKFEKAINISRLTKANKEIDKMLSQLA